jgi:tetratricopeptide (TPR) repeat protein
MRRAWALVQTKPEDAVREFERAAKSGADPIEVKKGLGVAKQRLNQLDDARRLLREVATARPKDADVRFEIASMDVAQKRFDEARPGLEIAIERDPPHIASLLLFAALARTPASGKQGLQALSRVDKANFAPFVESAEYAFARASFQAASGDAVAAESTLADAQQRNSIQPHLAIGLAEVSREWNHARFAEWLLSRASATSTANDSVHTALAELALARRHLPDASAALARLRVYEKPTLKSLLLQADLYELKHDQAERAHVLRKALDAIPKQDLAQRCKVELEYAIALNSAGNVKLSEAVVTEMLAGNPGFPPAQIFLAKLRLAQNRPDEALELAEAVAKDQPMRTEAYQVIVSAHLLKNARSDAEASARRFVAASASSHDAVALLANVLIGAKRFDAALREVELGLIRNPNQSELVVARITLTERTRGFAKAEAIALDAAHGVDPTIQRELAHLYERHKRPEAAIKVLREAAMQDSRILLELSALEVQAGRLTDAMATIRKLVDADPYDIEPLLRLGMLQERAGQAADAERTYDRVLILVPDNVVALNNLAALLSDPSRDTKRAVELARKATALVPSDLRVADTLGWALVQNQNPKDQYEAMRVLARSSSGLRTPDAYYHYGTSLVAASKLAEAKDALEHALASKPPFDKRPQAQSLLDSVRKRLNASAEATAKQ